MKLIFAAIFLTLAAIASFGQEPTKFKDDNEVPRITIEEAKKEYDAGTAVIVDARQSATYAEEHIKTAINIPNGSPASEFDKLPKGKKIIVYCA